MALADFGLSINSLEERPVTRLGTLDYMAPEVLICPDKAFPDDNKNNRMLQYGAEVDSWGIGVLAYELITGKPPFGMVRTPLRTRTAASLRAPVETRLIPVCPARVQSARESAMEAIMSKDPKFPPWLSEACRDFILKTLNKVPNLTRCVE